MGRPPGTKNKSKEESDNLPDLMSPAEVMEAVLLKGDLSKLTPDERNSYYQRVCESVGLNPLTRPLEYITLNGKMVLYARRDCADQLRKLHSVSIEILSKEYHDDLFSVHVRAKDGSGRQDEDFGVVSLPPAMKGDVRANAILKAVTKAKRRVTLSIAGLGFLDETEVDDIPASAKGPSRDDMPPREALKLAAPTNEARDGTPPRSTPKADPISSGPPRDAGPTRQDESKPHTISGNGHTFESWCEKYCDLVKTSPDKATVYAWIDRNQIPLDRLAKGKPSVYAKAKNAAESAMEAFEPKADKPKAAAKTAPAGNPDDPESVLAAIQAELDAVEDTDQLQPTWDRACEPLMAKLIFPPDQDAAQAIYNAAETRLGG